MAATSKVLDASGVPFALEVSLSPAERRKTFGTGLRGALRQGQAGGWASDHVAESEHYTGWNYVAIRALALQAAQATANVYQDGSDDQQRDLKKTYRAAHRQATWGMARVKSLSYSEEEGGQPLPVSHPLVKLLRRPNPYQSGASYRMEIIQQLCLTGTALIWKVKNLVKTQTVQRYVIPTSCAQPIPPQQGLPNGGFRIQPMSRTYNHDSDAPGMRGWRYAIGRNIPVEEFVIIRWPHPIFKDDGYSPLAAGSLWIDSSEQVDKTRWNHLRRGFDPSVFISPPDGWDGDQDELREVQDKFNTTYGGADNAGKVYVVNGSAAPVTTTPKDMSYQEGAMQLRDCILALHSTPPVAAGISESGSYAAYYASLKQFTELAVQPTLDFIADEETEQQSPEFGEGLVVEYEAKSIDDPTLQEEQLANDLTAGVRTKKEWRQLRGLPPFGDERDDELVGAAPAPAPGMGLPGEPGAPGIPGLPNQPGASAPDAADKPDETSTGVSGMKRPSILRMPGKSLHSSLHVGFPIRGKSSPSQKLSYTMLRLPAEISAAIKTFGAAILDDQLCPHCTKGRESDPHVTVLYGLRTDDPADVVKSAGGFGPIGLSLGDFDVFRSLEHDVLVVKVDSPKLHELRGKLATLDHVDTWSEYRPHVTVAYLKPGAAKGYLGHSPFIGQKFDVSHLEFSGASGARKTIDLGGRTKSTRTAAPAANMQSWLDRAAQQVISRYGLPATTNGNGQHHVEHHVEHADLGSNGDDGGFTLDLDRLKSATAVADPCGANAVGGGGFQPGNTCAKRALANPAPVSETPKSEWTPEEEAKFQRYRVWRDGQQEVLFGKFKSAIDAAGDTLTAEQRTQYMQAIEGVTAYMSDEMLRRANVNVDGVKFYADTLELTAEFAEAQLMQNPNLRIGGVFASTGERPTAGVLHLDGGVKGGIDVRDIYAHEMAHAFDGKPGEASETSEGGTYYPLEEVASHTPTWKLAYNAEINRPEAPLSEYALESREEGFAEFGRLVLTRPREARELFPKSYEAWQKLGLIKAKGEKPWARF